MSANICERSCNSSDISEYKDAADGERHLKNLQMQQFSAAISAGKSKMVTGKID